MKRHIVLAPFLFVLASIGPLSAWAQAASSTAEPTDPKATEQWAPVPKIVMPGKQDGAPPSDAVVLFDGRDLAQWETSKDHSPARWKVHEIGRAHV